MLLQLVREKGDAATRRAGLDRLQVVEVDDLDRRCGGRERAHEDAGDAAAG